MEHILSTPAAPARFLPTICLGAAAPVHSAVIERQALGFGDAAVRNLAGRCAAALERLVVENAYAHFASEAIEGAQTDGGTPTAWLERALHALEAETAATKAERGRHDARTKARSERLQLLKSAVTMRIDGAEHEIRLLAERVRSAEKNPFGNQADNQYQRLADAGLSPKQIKLVGIENPATKISGEVERCKARIATLQAELPALRAFCTDPRCSPAHLNGLDGFDALIAVSQTIVEEKEPNR
jgi:hypothetical protein